MFLLDDKAVPYSDPWLMPLAERRLRARRGQHRVAYLYQNPDNSTFRYRVYNMIQALAPRAEISATFFNGQELEVLYPLLEHIDVLVVGRYCYNHQLNRIITKARSYGKRVFFDVDDLIFDLDYAHLILNTTDQDLEIVSPSPWDVWFAYIGRVGASLKLCDAAITTNDFLAERIRAFTGKPAYIIPNFLNQEQLELSRALYRDKVARGFARDGQLHVGYFSGTPTHNRDLELAAGAVARLLDRRPDVVLRVVGFMELKGALKGYESRIERLAFHDYVNLQRLIATVEFNLMPLQDNIFTNSKSELKYFEAGIVGTLSIASPTYTYRKKIQDGINGYLAKNQEWDVKLEAALQQLDSYPEMAAKAYEDSEQSYAWQNHTEAIAELLFGRPPEVRAVCEIGA